MPANKNALLRYKTIDKCLQDHYRKWTLEDLIDACSDALYEFSGKADYVSRRTIQLDIQKMRSDELGYNAPIVVRNKKYYEYEDENYSITNTPLSDKDMELMGNAVAVLKQLNGFSAFSGMEDIVGRLEDHLCTAKMERTPVIFYEKNDSLKGLKHITPLYTTIVEKRPICLTYKSFNAKASQDFEFSAYCLKEFRNRWFVYGKAKGKKELMNLALDRIISISELPEGTKFIYDCSFDPMTFFDDVIGVSKTPGQKVGDIKFLANKEQASYIETKPLHKSQTVISREEDGSVIFQIKVVLNRELEREILSYGDGIQVLAPASLAKKIKSKLDAAAARYNG